MTTDGAEDTLDFGTDNRRMEDPYRAVSQRRVSRRPAVLGSLGRLGHALRFVAGVDEDLMDKVRWERSWYASLGGVVIGTATIAAFSMWFAVTESAGTSPAAALVPALIWFLFILIVDRWIISTRSTNPWQRLFLLCTRGFLAVLFGIVIAEPLVLRVFQTQVEQQVRNDRAEAIRMLRTDLLLCNPDPGDKTAPPVPADCIDRGLIMSITTTPAAKLRQLADLNDQAATLRKKVEEEARTLQSLETTARRECAGDSGPGLTGEYGDGINCDRDRKNADDYAKSHPIAAEQAALAELEKQIVDLQGEISTDQGAFRTERSAAVDAQMAALSQVEAPIGLLERMGALSELGRSSFTLLIGIFLVRLLFITIDCLPVLMKVVSGSTYYDRLVLSSLEDALMTHDQELGRKDDERAMRREEQEQRRRDHAIEMEHRLADRVDARAAAYERQARQQS